MIPDLEWAGLQHSQQPYPMLNILTFLPMLMLHEATIHVASTFRNQ